MAIVPYRASDYGDMNWVKLAWNRVRMWAVLNTAKTSVFIKKSQTVSGKSKFLLASEELMSLSFLRKKPVSAENPMLLYYKDHSVNSVQRSNWCSVGESLEINRHIAWEYC